MKDKVLIYHADCPDGFGSAWSFWNKFGDEMEYIPMKHHQDIPDLSGKEVYFADFCLHREAMIAIEKIAKSVVVLDHHKTSLEECHDLKFCNFDMYHSGAVLSWMYLFPDKETPEILLCVEDRDLYNWKVKDSKSILTTLDTFKFTFENWSNFDKKLKTKAGRAKIISGGNQQLRYIDSLLVRTLRSKHTVTIQGYTVPAANTGFFASELGNIMSSDAPFAAVYYFDGENFRVSLRSCESFDGWVDVALIAQKYDGGGHKHAAAFLIKNISDLK